MPRYRHPVQQNPERDWELEVVVEKKLSMFGKCRPGPLNLERWSSGGVTFLNCLRACLVDVNTPRNFCLSFATRGPFANTSKF
jgi:hypothetical protein